jgi:DNA-directed RNA polymerase subunit alpha
MTAVDTINEKAAAEFFARGHKAEQAGDFDKAIENYQHALNEDPDHEEASFRLAVLFDRKGMDPQAIELYERICGGSPVRINALLNLAVLYEDNNLYEDARRCLQAVLDTDPNHPRARLYLKDVESASEMYVDEEQRSRQQRDAVLDTPVMDFELSVRSRNALKKMNIATLGDLLRVREADLLAFKNFGETSLSEIKSLLAGRGLRLGQLAEQSTTTTPPPASFSGDASLLAIDGDMPSELLEKPVSDLELSVRSRKALQRLDIQSVGELAQRTEDELLGCKNFGQTSLNEIKQILASYGLSLRRIED